MKCRKPKAILYLFALLTGFAACAVVWLFPRSAAETQHEITVREYFVSPSQVPAGNVTWILIGSKDEYPEDVTVASEEGLSRVLQTVRLSPRALGVQLVLGGKGLHGLLLASVARDLRGKVSIASGPALPALCVPDNIFAEDLAQGSLFIEGPHLYYGYVPEEGVDFKAVRLHNRATGLWHRREYGVEKEQKAAEQPIWVGPGFGETDPFEADTDGDGVPDLDDPEPAPLPHGLIGVTLKPGTNTIDIVVEDERGYSSWRTLEVVATFEEEETGL